MPIYGFWMLNLNVLAWRMNDWLQGLVGCLQVLFERWAFMKNGACKRPNEVSWPLAWEFGRLAVAPINKLGWPDRYYCQCFPLFAFLHHRLSIIFNQHNEGGIIHLSGLFRFGHSLHPQAPRVTMAVAVRFARASDLVITSKIAFRSFSMSPWNPFYRPFAKDFPEDVEKSYLREQQEALGNKRKLFVVVEIDEDRCVCKDTKVSKHVVGFAIWNFTSSQTRVYDPIPVDISESSEGN